MAAGLVETIGRHVADGGRLARPETVAARLAICEACEHFRSSDRRCGGAKGCGCYVDAKTTLRTARCPLEPPKWGPEMPGGVTSPDSPE